MSQQPIEIGSIMGYCTAPAREWMAYPRCWLLQQNQIPLVTCFANLYYTKCCLVNEVYLQIAEFSTRQHDNVLNFTGFWDTRWQFSTCYESTIELDKGNFPFQY